MSMESADRTHTPDGDDREVSRGGDLDLDLPLGAAGGGGRQGHWVSVPPDLDAVAVGVVRVASRAIALVGVLDGANGIVEQVVAVNDGCSTADRIVGVDNLGAVEVVLGPSLDSGRVANTSDDDLGNLDCAA